MPRSSARLSVGTSASGSLADTAIAPTRCAIRADSTSIWPSAVGVVGPVKITSASSSFAASSAPLCTASKKPLPRDFATRPTRVRAGFSGSLPAFLPQPPEATANTAHAAATTNFFTLGSFPRLRDLLHLVFRQHLGDDDLDARGAEVFQLLGFRAVIGHDGVDAIEAGNDHRRLAPQLGAVRHHDDVLTALQ